jgi:hypothetical protein
MRRTFFFIVFSLGLAVTGRAVGEQTMPVLHYTPPSNAYRGAGGAADDYSFNGFNASVQVYPFRPFNGDIQQAFQRTLLRDWITPMHQEENVGAPPQFQTIQVPGAQLALTASFAENIVGLPKPHMRMIIVAGGQAAIVDASAGTMQSWQQAVPHLNAMAATLRVEAGRAPPPLAPEAGRAVAGLYMGMKQKYMATMVNVIGGGYYTNALHFYVLSADGRVYRAYDKLEVPGGDAARFDFDAAERRDPGNSGHYTIDGGKLLIHMGGPAPESIVTDLPRDGAVTINTVLYRRQSPH